MRKWVRDLMTARKNAPTFPSREEIYLNVLEIAKLDSGNTLIINTPNATIIITSEKYPIDTPLK